MNSIIEILVDNSNSMGDYKGEKDISFLLPDLTTRMSFARYVLSEEILPLLQGSSRIILKKFYSTDKEERALNQDIELYDGVFNQSQLISKISELVDPVNTGGTPITKAVLASLDSLKNIPNSEHRLILITDGQEHKGNYESAALQAIRSYNNPCRIFIIGIAQTDDAKSKARNLANITNGAFADLLNRHTVKSDLAQFKSRFLQQSVAKEIKQEPKPVPPPAVSPSAQSQFAHTTPTPHPVNPTPVKPNPVNTTTGKQPQQPVNPPSASTHKTTTANTETTKTSSAPSNMQDLQQAIQEQIINSRQVLEFYAELAEKLRITSLIESGIPATTMTVDDDYVAVGRITEQFVYELLCKEHGESNVHWLNKNGESRKLHDIELKNEKGEVFFIECKGTRRNKLTFYLTADEWSHFLKYKDRYQLYRIFNADGEMRAKWIPNLFDALLNEEVVPYLLEPEVLRQGRVFLTITTEQGFINKHENNSPKKHEGIKSKLRRFIKW